MKPNISQKNNRIKLNLGCGSVRPSGWINTDSSLNANIQRFPFIGKRVSQVFNPIKYEDTNVQYMNLNKRWSYRDNSVDIVYASHLFEHLSMNAAELFVNEAYRCLKPGGIVRIVVPDLYQIAKRYVSEYELTTELTDTTKFIMWAINMHREGQYKSPNFLTKLIFEFQGYPHQHKYMYDSNSLRLKFSKFQQHLLLSYGVSKYIPEIADVEGTKESYLSVYFEAKKPL